MRWLRIAGTIWLGLFTACGESKHGAGGLRANSAGAGGAAGANGAAASGGTTSSSGGSAAQPTAGDSPGGGSGGMANGTGGVLSAGGAAGKLGAAGANLGGSNPVGSAGKTGAGTGGAAGTTGGNGTSGTSAVSGSGGQGEDSPDVTVRLDQPKQVMVGFGISDPFTPALTDAQADQLFDTNHGIGLSILRIAMSSNGGPFSTIEWEDIKAAKARGVDTFIATAWTAAAACKSNKNENDGGHLDADCYESWATTLAAFPALVKTNTGVDLYGIAPQREPDFASCGVTPPCYGDFPTMLYTSDELVTFINTLGPKLHALTPPVRLMGPETEEWLHLWTNRSVPGSTDPLMGTGYDYGHALFHDATAWGFLDVLTTHQYDDALAEPWPSDVPQTKPLFMTEMGGLKYGPEAGPSKDIANGVAVAGWIHDAIVNGPASAWLYFDRQSISIDDNEGLFLKDGTSTKRIYTLGNFSRFVRPGYTRVNITGMVPADILLTGYRGDAGTVVVVAINRSTTPATVPIFISGGTLPASFARYLTSATDDLAPRTEVPVSGGAFSAELDGMTVNTFVGGAQ